MRLASVSLQVTCYISSLAATSDASPVGEVPLPNTFTLMSLAGLLMTSYILLQTGSYIITLADLTSALILTFVINGSFGINDNCASTSTTDQLWHSFLFCIFQWHSLDIYVIHFDFELDENSAIYDSKLLLFLCAWSIFCKCSSFFLNCIYMLIFFKIYNIYIMCPPCPISGVAVTCVWYQLTIVIH